MGNGTFGQLAITATEYDLSTVEFVRVGPPGHVMLAAICSKELYADDALSVLFLETPGRAGCMIEVRRSRLIEMYTFLLDL